MEGLCGNPGKGEAGKARQLMILMNRQNSLDSPVVHLPPSILPPVHLYAPCIAGRGSSAIQTEQIDSPVPSEKKFRETSRVECDACVSSCLLPQGRKNSWWCTRALTFSEDVAIVGIVSGLCGGGAYHARQILADLAGIARYCQIESGHLGHQGEVRGVSQSLSKTGLHHGTRRTLCAYRAVSGDARRGAVNRQWSSALFAHAPSPPKSSSTPRSRSFNLSSSINPSNTSASRRKPRVKSPCTEYATR